MRIGKIDYINLLPFHIFMKRYTRSLHLQMANRSRRNVPSAINKAFHTRRIDAAFISSIAAERCRCAPLGIVADGEVWSVLLIPGETMVKDSASATSNALAELLGLTGEVIIGDPALKAWSDGVEAIDLAAAWKARTGLPFVFARLCHHGHDARIHKIVRAFGRVRPRIPYYLLKQTEARTGIAAPVIRAYLKRIHYPIGAKEQQAIRTFRRMRQR